MANLWDRQGHRQSSLRTTLATLNNQWMERSLQCMPCMDTMSLTTACGDWWCNDSLQRSQIFPYGGKEDLSHQMLKGAILNSNPIHSLV